MRAVAVAALAALLARARAFVAPPSSARGARAPALAAEREAFWSMPPPPRALETASLPREPPAPLDGYTLGDMRHVRVYDAEGAAYAAVVRELELCCADAVEARGAFALAVSGPKVLDACAALLPASRAFDAAKSHVFAAAERLGGLDGPGDGRANVAAAFAAVPDAQVHGLDARFAAPAALAGARAAAASALADEAAAEYEARLRAHPLLAAGARGGPAALPVFDLAIVESLNDGAFSRSRRP